MKLSEQWFQRYAEERGLSGWDEPEPEIPGAPETQRRPDFRVMQGELAAICEVKEFTTDVVRKRLAANKVAALSDEEVFGTVRNSVDAAAKQLKPYRELGEPLVVVLANPHNADVSISDPDELLFALYGNPAYSFAIDPESQEVHNEQLIYSRDGAITQNHAFISAVVTLHKRDHWQDYWDDWSAANRHHWVEIEDHQEAANVMLQLREEESKRDRAPPGEYIFARVFETISSSEGKAVPLSREMFNGPKDERRAFDEDTRTIVPV